MYLHEDPKWKSVRIGVRSIVPADVKLFPAVTWHELLFHIEVEPTQFPHRYKQLVKEVEQ